MTEHDLPPPPDVEREARLPVHLAVKYRLAGKDAFMERYAVNLSRNGIFLVTTEIQPVGTELEFEVQTQDGSNVLSGIGVVRWTRRHDPERGLAPGLGIEFTQLDDANRALVNQMVDSLVHKVGQDANPSKPAFTDDAVKGWLQSLDRARRARRIKRTLWISSLSAVGMSAMLVAGWYLRGALVPPPDFPEADVTVEATRVAPARAPATVEPQPTAPAAVEPQPTAPAAVEPQPTAPAAVEPQPTAPAASGEAPTSISASAPLAPASQAPTQAVESASAASPEARGPPSGAEAREGSRAASRKPAAKAGDIQPKAHGYVAQVLPPPPPEPEHRKEPAPVAVPVQAQPPEPVVDPEERAKDAIARRVVIIKNCYERLLRDNPDLAGKVVIEISTNATGARAEVTITEDTTRDVRVTRCVKMALKDIQFLGIKEPLNITVPIKLQPQQGAGR